MNAWERRIAKHLTDSEYHFLQDYDRWLRAAFSQIPFGADEHTIHAFHLTVGHRLSAILAKHAISTFTSGQAHGDEDCKAILATHNRKLSDLPRITAAFGTDFTPQDAIKVLQKRSIALAGDVELDATNAVKGVLLQHLTGELTRRQAEEQISGILKSNMDRASLIVTTETTYAYNHGRLMQYRANGVDYVRYSAVMDGRTCSICASRDGKVSPITAIGGDVPPVHGRCRCVLSPVFSALKPELLTPEALNWSKVTPLAKSWVPEEAPRASGKVFERAQPPNVNALVNYDKALIDPSKVVDYTLNKDHPIGGHKALLIDQLLGYDSRRSKEFIKFLREQLPHFPAVDKGSSKFGTRYEVVVRVPDLKGRNVRLTTAWIVDSGVDPNYRYTGNPRFVSAYIK